MNEKFVTGALIVNGRPEFVVIEVDLFIFSAAIIVSMPLSTNQATSIVLLVLQTTLFNISSVSCGKAVDFVTVPISSTYLVSSSAVPG